jgi:hypothetical protein
MCLTVTTMFEHTPQGAGRPVLSTLVALLLAVSPGLGCSDAAAPLAESTGGGGDPTQQGPRETTSAEESGEAEPGEDTGAAITAFVINGVSGTVGASSVHIALPPGTKVANLTPTITFRGVALSPASGVAQDFGKPVLYTVTGTDGSTRSYTVTVSLGTSSPKDYVLHVDFEGQPVGPYTKNQSDWPGSKYFIGLSRCRIIADGVTGTRALEVTYPAGVVSPNNGGAQWETPLPKSYDELYLSYRIKFMDPDGNGEQQFEPTHGGKLPGLAGGSVPSGGTASPTDGFSARMMWNDLRGLRQYMYYKDKQQPYGDVWGYRAGGTQGGALFQFSVGVWYRVEHRVVLNKPGLDDGLVQAWVDGQLFLDKKTDHNGGGLSFRPAGATWGIDHFFFSTFYGGSGPDYTTTHDNKIVFDDFIASTKPITH